MELSPEEKDKIYKEEKARLEAQEKAKKELKEKKTKKGCLGCLGCFGAIIVLSIIILMAGGVFNSGDKTKKSTNQSSTPAQQQETKREVGDEPKKLATIPGISAIDVCGNLKNGGFSCTGPKVGSDGISFWECKEETSEHLYLLEIIGNAPSEILTVQATALNYSSKTTDSVAKDFFGYVASVPYDNSDQVSAKNWVMKNIDGKTDKVINGVRFTIAGNNRSRILTIAHENSDLD